MQIDTQSHHAARHWPLLTTTPLLVFALVGLAPVSSLAQSEAVAPAGNEQRLQQYNLPAGALSSSLKALARQSGMTLSVAPDLIANKSALAVNAALSVEQALTRLLEDTGLSGAVNGATIMVSRTVNNSVPAEEPTPLTQLAQINVTSASASGVEKDLASAPASISVVGKEELEGKAYRDITDALQSVPGVYVDEGAATRGGNQEISIRGWDPKYTKILVDGMPQSSSQGYYNGNGSGSEYGWVPPVAAIERIEIVRGPMSSLYGTDAMGGVINIITKTVPDKWGGSVSLDNVTQDNDEFGDSNNAQYYLSGPLLSDKVSLTVYGGRYHRDEDEIDASYQEYTRINNTVQLGWAPNEANKLELEVGYATQDSKGTDVGTGDAFDLERVRQNQSVSHNFDWGGGMRTRSFVQHAFMDNRSQNATYERYTAETSTVVPMGSQVVTVGAQYRTQETENPDRALGAPNLQRWDAALFAEHEWYITDPFALTTGLRYVNDENYGSEFVPRVYGVYALTRQFTLKGGVSAGYRTPDLKEGDSNWLEGGGGPSLPGGRDVGNSDLKPEESRSYEIGAYWTGYSGLNANVTVYHTDYDNKIEKPVLCPTTPDGNGGFLFNCEFQGQFYQALFQYMNVDKAELQGVETAVAYPITDTLSVDSSYTFTESEQLSGENAGDPLNNQPRHRANMRITWQALESTRLWSSARYRGRTEFFGRGGPDDSVAPGYTLVDCGAQYEATESMSVYGGIYNLFDESLTLADFGRIVDGRRLSLGTTLTF